MDLTRSGRPKTTNGISQLELRWLHKSHFWSSSVPRPPWFLTDLFIYLLYLYTLQICLCCQTTYTLTISHYNQTHLNIKLYNLNSPILLENLTLELSFYLIINLPHLRWGKCRRRQPFSYWLKTHLCTFAVYKKYTNLSIAIETKLIEYVLNNYFLSIV